MDKLIVVACHDNQELEYLSDVIYTVENGRIYEEDEHGRTKLDEEERAAFRHLETMAKGESK